MSIEIETVEMEDVNDKQEQAGAVASSVAPPHSVAAANVDSPTQVPGDRRTVGILCAVTLVSAIA